MRWSSKPKHVTQKEITKIFGNTRRPGTSQWLAANLLVRVGQYQPGKHGFSYHLNPGGVEKVHRLLHAKAPPSVTDIAMERFAPILQGSAEPEYITKGHRNYAPHQTLSREIRAEVFSGWWDYDIEASAPSLVHQYTSARYKERFPGWPQEDPFPTVAKLYLEKAAVRAALSVRLDLPAEQVKEILNALFFKANTAPNHHTRLFKLVSSQRVLRTVLDDPFIKELRTDVKVMWRWALLWDTNDRRAAHPRPQRQVFGLPTTAASHRQQLYQRLERQVMDVVERVAKNSGAQVVAIHDGFMTPTRVDLELIQDAVLKETGYRVRLSESRLGLKKVDREQESWRDLL